MAPSSRARAVLTFKLPRASADPLDLGIEEAQGQLNPATGCGRLQPAPGLRCQTPAADTFGLGAVGPSSVGIPPPPLCAAMLSPGSRHGQDVRHARPSDRIRSRLASVRDPHQRERDAGRVRGDTCVMARCRRTSSSSARERGGGAWRERLPARQGLRRQVPVPRRPALGPGRSLVDQKRGQGSRAQLPRPPQRPALQRDLRVVC